MKARVNLTKFLFSRNDLGSLSRKEIIETVKQSLRNLGMEYIDLVIIHKYDVNCPIEGTEFQEISMGI